MKLQLWPLLAIPLFSTAVGYPAVSQIDPYHEPVQDAVEQPWVAPIDIQLEVARLNPHYTLREDLYGVQKLHDHLVGQTRETMFEELGLDRFELTSNVTVYYLLDALDQTACIQLPDAASFEQMFLVTLLPTYQLSLEERRRRDANRIGAVTGENTLYVIDQVRDRCP